MMAILSPTVRRLVRAYGLLALAALALLIIVLTVREPDRTEPIEQGLGVLTVELT